MYKDVIGVVGGMGSYATCDFFCRLINNFPAEKEWDRPRIVIDNNCTMPSRVRAILYKEERYRLVKLLTDSILGLKSLGATKIVLACNTSHVFLEEIYDEIEKRTGNKEVNVINMIETCAQGIYDSNIKEVALMATEGTIDSGIYNRYFDKYGIKVISPAQEKYTEFRYLIECVKQNSIDKEAIDRFVQCILSLGSNNVLLGCTELPIYMRYVNSFQGVNIYDPLYYLIQRLKAELE